MSDAPDDIQRAAEAVFVEICKDTSMHLMGASENMVFPIERAIMAERRRALKILAADKEWGADFDEAMDRIRTGSEPRYIPGWSE